MQSDHDQTAGRGKTVYSLHLPKVHFSAHSPPDIKIITIWLYLLFSFQGTEVRRLCLDGVGTLPPYTREPPVCIASLVTISHAYPVPAARNRSEVDSCLTPIRTRRPPYSTNRELFSAMQMDGAIGRPLLPRSARRRLCDRSTGQTRFHSPPRCNRPFRPTSTCEDLHLNPIAMSPVSITRARG